MSAVAADKTVARSTRDCRFLVPWVWLTDASLNSQMEFMIPLAIFPR